MTPLLMVLAFSPVLEPDPGALVRSQPRDVRAPGEDSTGLWTVDDDPATSYKGPSFIWMGRAVEGAKTMKVFVRAGCQESKEAFDGWSRPRTLVVSRHVYRSRRMMMMPYDDDDEEADSRRTVTRELADVAGWQSIEVPYWAAFNVKVKDTYAGKAHSESCISDVRVYTDGKPSLSEEQLAFEQVKRAITERLMRAPMAPKRLPQKMVQAKAEGDAPAPKTELSLQSPDTQASLTKKARATANALRAVWQTPVSKLEAKGWKRVSIDFVTNNDASLEESLAGRDSALGRGDPLLCTDDFKLAAVKESPAAGWKDKMKALQKLEPHPIECQAACTPIYASTSVSALETRQDCARLCGHVEYNSESKADVQSSGVFIKGGLEKPEQLLIISSRERGEREVYRQDERELLVYENGRVSSQAAITYDPQNVQVALVRWNDDRSAVTGLARIWLDGNKTEDFTRFEAKPEHASVAGELGDSALAFEQKR